MRNSYVAALLLIPAVAFAQPSMQPPAPMAAPVGEPSGGAVYRNGMTFEANLGAGWIHASGGGLSDNSDAAIAGLSLGVGGWISPDVAITGRIAGLTLSQNGANLSHEFIGPSLQYWANDHVWFGGGIGLSLLALRGNNSGGQDSRTAFGMDLRAGYNFIATGENTVNLSIEVNPGFYSDQGTTITYTGIGFLLGYQHL